MKIDLDGIEKISDYVTVPSGTYLCKIAEVRTAQTRHGDERWVLRLVVAEGEFTGRVAAFDGLVFSARGMQRVKHVLGALGLPNTGAIDLEPADLVGRSAFVDIRDGRYEHPDTGEVVRRNEVPYAGYRQVPSDDTEPPALTESIPF